MLVAAYLGMEISIMKEMFEEQGPINVYFEREIKNFYLNSYLFFVLMRKDFGSSVTIRPERGESLTCNRKFLRSSEETLFSFNIFPDST